MMSDNSRRGMVEWTPANIVTTIRICCIPLFLVLLLAPWAMLFWDEETARSVQAIVAMVVFALISLTDGIDGYLARSRNEVTVFGKFMDPIADKVLVISALVALVEIGSLPSWIPIIIIARELLVSGLRMLVASAGVVIAANWIGKAKTFTTMVAACLFILMGAPVFAALQPWFDYIAWAFMILAVILTIASMIDYFAGSWKLLASDRSKPVPARASDQSDAGACVGDGAPACESGVAQDGSVDSSLLEGSHGRAARVVVRAQERHLTLGTAESCTGGLIAAALTSVPGSSSVAAGGIVSYTPYVKEHVLGVDEADMEQFGIVSLQTACRMAEGARRTLGVDIAVSTTGIAGPTGGTAQNPVGSVWFGLATPRGVTGEYRQFPGTREEVRAQAVEHALEMLDQVVQ